MTISGTLRAPYAWLESHAYRPNYAWMLALVLVCLSLILAYPCFNCHDPEGWVWGIVQHKAADLTSNLEDVPRNIWLSKKVFRLTVPVFMHITSLGPLGVIVVQYLLGSLMLVYIYKLALRILQDGVSSTLLTAGIVFLYFGRAAFGDLEYLWFDGYAFFFLIMAMYTQRSWVIFLFGTAAAWTDERGFMALGIVFLYHQLHTPGRSGIPDIKELRPNTRGSAVLLAILSYLGIRWWLSHQFGMSTPLYGAEPAFFSRTMPFLPIGTWTFLEGFWLLYAFAFVHALKARRHFIAFALGATVLAGIIISGCVSDITRSGSFLVPIIFIVAYYVKEVLPRAELRNLILASFCITLLFPATMVCIDWRMDQWFQRPLPIVAAQHLVDAVLVRLK